MSERLKEPVYADELPAAKECLNDCILQIIPTILKEFDRVRQLTHLMQHFDQLSIVVLRSSLDKETKPTLKFGLDDSEKDNYRGYKAPLTQEEAIKIRTGMDPSLYAALCEEGLLRAIEVYESIDYTDAYDNDLRVLYGLLEFVQTAGTPFDIAEQIKMFPER
ncbi:hypothetical protein ACFL3T_01175 [Patescibacteria group bacterium]